MKVILVIEDDAAIRENIVEILELEGYKVFSAPNGKLGVELAEKEIPNLVLCDIMMPQLDGFGVFMHLSKNLKTAGSPFIFLTGKAELTDKMSGLQLGADDYITKPFDPDLLVTTIKSKIEKHEEKIEELNQRLLCYLDELEKMLHLTSHRVRSPLSTCMGLINLLEQSDKKPVVDEEVVQILGHLKKSMHSLEKFTQDLTNMLNDAHVSKTRMLGAYRGFKRGEG